LEDQEGLVDIWEGVRGSELNSLVEALEGLVELLLVQEKFSVVVVNIARLWEFLQCLLENVHGVRNVSKLILGNTVLDVREDELGLKLDRLDIILGSGLVLAGDEEDLAAMNK
jgi:hypothetical protein